MTTESDHASGPLDECAEIAGLDPSQVDLAVAGHADRERFGGAVGVIESHDDVLEGVRGGPGTILSGQFGNVVEMIDEGVDGRRIGSVLHVRGAGGETAPSPVTTMGSCMLAPLSAN